VRGAVDRLGGEGLLHDAVLEGVEADHDQPATDGERLDGGGQRAGQHTELVVDLDAQGLERPLGGVAPGAPGGGRDGVADQLGQPGGAGERLPGPLPLDGGGDPAGEALLAVDPEHPGQVAAGVGVHDVGRGAGAAGVHPHVQRGVGGVAEAAGRPVQLQRGDAEVEQHPLHLRDAQVGQHVGELVEDGGHQGRPVAAAGGREPGGGLGAGVGVAVQADQSQPRVGTQQGQRVTGQAEGAVDEDGAVGVEGGGQQLGHPVEEDGDVQRGPGGLGAAHRLLLGGLGTACSRGAGPGRAGGGARWGGWSRVEARWGLRGV
jgi:hypothetical protein